MKNIKFLIASFLVISLFSACFVYVHDPNGGTDYSDPSSSVYKKINSDTMDFSSVANENSELYMFVYNTGDKTLNHSYYEKILRGAARNAIDVDDEDFTVELEDSLGEGYHCGLALNSVMDAYKNLPPLVNERAATSQNYVRANYKKASRVGDIGWFYKKYTKPEDGKETLYYRQAECVYVNDVCQVFVEEDCYDDDRTNDSYTNYNGTIYVTEAGAQRIADNFKKVYLPVQNIMGKATLDNLEYSNVIETSEKITILIADLGKYEGSATLGYFYSGDLYCKGQDDSSSNNLNSNERMMITLNVEGFSKDFGENQLFSTLGHELNHMINFIKKNLEKKNDFSTWFTEMLSAITEDFTQDILGIDSALQDKRLTRFNYGSSCGMIDGWNDEDGKVVHFNYGNAYAFGAYLVRNYGGTNFVEQMATNGYIGKEAITAALRACGYTNETYDTVLQKFGLVMANPYGYDKKSPTLYKDVSDGIYSFKRINLYEYDANMSDENLKFYSNPNWTSTKHKGPCFYKCTGKNIYTPDTLYQGGFFAVYLGKAKDWNYALSFDPPATSSDIKAYIYINN